MSLRLNAYPIISEHPSLLIYLLTMKRARTDVVYLSGTRRIWYIHKGELNVVERS